MNLGLVQEKDPNERTGFWLGQDDASLRQKFVANGFTKVLIMHVPVALECLDPNYFVQVIIDGAASTKKQIEGFSPANQELVRREVAERAKALLDQGIPIAIDTIVIVAQK